MDQTALDAAVAAAAPQYPAAAALVEKVRAAGPLIAGSLGWLLRERREEFWRTAEHVATLSRKLEGSPVESLAEYTVMYLKEQLRFEKTGEYSNDDFDEVRSKVYDNPDVMRRFYLEGLMLTHAFWPIHLDIHGLFSRAFVSRVADEGVGLEVGFGHGLYLLEVLTRRPGTRTHSFDISPFSLEYATRVLRAGGVAPGRFELQLGDVREPLPAAEASQGWAVFAEVLEHIPNPREALLELGRVLRPGAPLFATTVLFSNAIDHITQFESPEQVRELLTSAGFDIAEERAFAVKDYVPGSKDRTIDLAYVAVRRGASS
jgi:ubiquinone/menaquinone biosynthesis C-methylase UbiE